jgi:hypothetical protein
VINELASGSTVERSNSKEKSKYYISSNSLIDDDKSGVSLFNFSKNVQTCDEGMSPALKIGVVSKGKANK